MTETKDSNKTFRGLMTGTIVLSSVIMALVVIIIIFTLVFLLVGLTQDSPGVIVAWMLSVVAFPIVELLASVALIVLISISLAKVGVVKNVNAKNFRVTFAILLGVFVVLSILTGVINFIPNNGGITNYISSAQLTVVIIILVFACVYKAKAR